MADPNLTGLPEELASLPNVSFCETLRLYARPTSWPFWWPIRPFGRSREELMRRVVIDATGLTYQYA